jgi:hypothetical protein
MTLYLSLSTNLERGSVMSKYLKYVLKNCFEIGYILYIISLLIGLTEFQNINHINVFQELLRYIAYILFVIKLVYMFIKSQHKIIFLGISFIFFILSLEVTRAVESITFITTIIILLCSYYIDFEKFLSTIFKINVIFIIFTITASLLKVIPNLVFEQGTRIRYAIGFTYPSHLMSLLFFNILSYIYIHRKNINIKDYIIIEIITIITYIITDAKAGMLFITCILIALYIAKKYKNRIKESSFIIYFITITPIIFSIVIILACYYYNKNNNVMYAINKIYNGRLGFGWYALRNYGINTFGRKIQWHGWVGQTAENMKKYNFVDISYVKILLDYGIIACSLIVVGFSSLIYNSYKKKDYYLSFCIIFICLYSLIEPRLFEIHFNPFILLLMNSKYFPHIINSKQSSHEIS